MSLKTLLIGPRSGIVRKYVQIKDQFHAQVFAVVNEDGSPIGGAGGSSETATKEDTQLLVKTAVEEIAKAIGAEDSPAIGGGKGIRMLALRHDSDTHTADDGDLTDLKLDEKGRLKVATQPASLENSTRNVTAVGETVYLDAQRASNVMFHVKNTGAAVLAAGTFVFEGSIDSTDGNNGTWFGIQCVRSNANSVETQIALSGIAAGAGFPSAWEASVNACLYFRVRCTVAVTAGAIATWTIQPGSYATEPVPGVQVTPAQAVTLAALPAIAGQGAESAVAAGNAVRVGGRVRTAADITLAANDAADLTMTSAGQVLVKPGGLTESSWSANIPVTTTGAVALITAGGASLKRHLTGLQAINTGAATVELILLDAATEVWRMPLPPNVPLCVSFESTHLKIAAVNTAINVALSAAGTVRVCAQGYTAP